MRWLWEAVWVTLREWKVVPGEVTHSGLSCPFTHSGIRRHRTGTTCQRVVISMGRVRKGNGTNHGCGWERSWASKDRQAVGTVCMRHMVQPRMRQPCG